MTDVRNQRQLASRVFKVGYHRIKIDPEMIDNVTLALTREDIRKHRRDGNIVIRRIKGISRGRARANHPKKQRGQRMGLGSRRGTANARSPKKRIWINKIRLQRAYLRQLRDEGYLTPTDYCKLYRQAKGNMFRSKAYLRTHIEDHGLSQKRLPEIQKKKKRRISHIKR